MTKGIWRSLIWEPFWKGLKGVLEVTVVILLIVFLAVVMTSPIWLAIKFESLWPLLLFVVAIWFLGLLDEY